MKRVSFKVAKAIKEAGYPQDKDDWTSYFYEKEGILYPLSVISGECYPVYAAPTYLEVWLWLWKNGISIQIEKDDLAYDEEYCTAWTKDKKILYQKYYENSVENPEDAISEAINYLVENDLIK